MGVLTHIADDDSGDAIMDPSSRNPMVIANHNAPSSIEPSTLEVPAPGQNSLKDVASELDRLFDPDHTTILANIIDHVAASEGPMPLDWVTRGA